MARKVATLVLLFGYCSCMEMRETVERTVMVRTTGSDLQPAATGYIYKKESDGPVSVTKMGESEVIEQFSKLYKTPKTPLGAETHSNLEKQDFKKPQSFSSSPLTARSHVSEKHKKASHERSVSPTSQDSAPLSSSSEDVIKPVVEKAEEKIDGIANEEFDKLFEDYMKQIKYNNNFADYLHGLDHNEQNQDPYHGYGRGDHDNYYLNKFVYEGRAQEKGELKDDFLVKDPERYYAYNYKEPKPKFYENDDHGRHYIHEHDSTGVEHSHDGPQRQGGRIGGFHEDLKIDDGSKNNGFYDRHVLKGTRHAYRGGYGDYGSDAKGYDGRNSHESEKQREHFGKSDDVQHSGDDHDDTHSSENDKESEQAYPKDFSTKGQYDTRKSYRYDIKH